ncbi:MAG: family 16 glycoside hydrolase, partial [Verrucomicrobiota bacterium]
MNKPLARRRVLKAAAAAPLIPWAAHAQEESVGRLLFDGMSLEGWHAIPRIYVPRDETFAAMPSEKVKEEVFKLFREGNPMMKARYENRGIWTIEEGAIVGKQVPGSTEGSYLMSDETFGDFELTLEARPDWPIDTGIMVRAHEIGTVGFQILLDTRPDGCLGGVFGNGIGQFKAMPYLVTGDEQPGFQVANLRQSEADKGQFIPEGSASFADFATRWKVNDWNRIKIRCRGELPVIETWINDIPITRLDTAKLGDYHPSWDPDFVR